jgi:hypothetical protein
MAVEDRRNDMDVPAKIVCLEWNRLSVTERLLTDATVQRAILNNSHDSDNNPT